MFRYRAIGPTGDVQTGMMDAATEAEVVARLQRQGAMPMRAEPANSESWLTALWHAEFTTRKGLRRQETADFIRELATMLSAGLPQFRIDEADVKFGIAPIRHCPPRYPAASITSL